MTDSPNGVTPDQMKKLQNIMRQFGSMTQSSMTQSKSGIPVQTSTYLSDAPRAVPLAFRVAGLSWKWWEAFTVLMVFTAPIALWIFVPRTLPIPFVALIIVIGYLRIRGFGTRVGLLKWGKVATVVGVDPVSVGTYYSGVTYSNMRMAQATGWDVERRMYSGPGTTTKIKYVLDGVSSELTLTGLSYTSGVILAHSKNPSIALCVSSFPYDLNPNSDGDWVPKLGVGMWIGVLASVVMFAGLIVGAVWSVSALWL